jgi:hypothetical protein
VEFVLADELAWISCQECPIYERIPRQGGTCRI